MLKKNFGIVILCDKNLIPILLLNNLTSNLRFLSYSNHIYEIMQYIEVNYTNILSIKVLSLKISSVLKMNVL